MMIAKMIVLVKLIQEWYMSPEVREKEKDFSGEKSKISINFIVMIIIYNKCS